jgi:hypothetical protein
VGTGATIAWVGSGTAAWVGSGTAVASAPHAMTNTKVNIRGVNISTKGLLNRRYAMIQSPCFEKTESPLHSVGYFRI